jgi:stage II sporulation protein AA (anti-sigma F factor antagonist)
MKGLKDMRVKVQHSDGCVTASLFGELDHHSAPEVRGALDDVLQRFSNADLVLDLKNLSFMDSSGLGVVLGRYKLLKSRGKAMYVKNVGGQIDKVFNISGIYRIVRKIN